MLSSSDAVVRVKRHLEQWESVKARSSIEEILEEKPNNIECNGKDSVEGALLLSDRATIDRPASRKNSAQNARRISHQNISHPPNLNGPLLNNGSQGPPVSSPNRRISNAESSVPKYGKNSNSNKLEQNSSSVITVNRTGNRII